MGHPVSSFTSPGISLGFFREKLSVPQLLQLFLGHIFNSSIISDFLEILSVPKLWVLKPCKKWKKQHPVSEHYNKKLFFIHVLYLHILHLCMYWLYIYIYMCIYTFINMYMVNYVEYRGVYWIFMKTRRTVFNNYSKRFNQLFITIWGRIFISIY